MKILKKELKQLQTKTLAGEIAFKLYDTYGFPLDLTEDILREHGITVEQKGFEQLMQEQKKRAKANWKGSGDSKDNKIYVDLAKTITATKFLGYEENSCQAKIQAIIANNKIGYK